MSLPNQFLVKYSNITLTTNGIPLDITNFVKEIEVIEDIFSTFIYGSITILDVPGSRILLRAPINGSMDTTIDFSFSGYEGNNKTEQKPIEITNENYFVYEIKSFMTDHTTELCKIYFMHKCYFDNLSEKISKGYEKKKISEIVKDIGDHINLQWNEIEDTKDTITTGLIYKNPFSHILNLARSSSRNKNINDINYFFWQNINGQHNFVSLGELFSKTPSFGQDTNTGFLYSHYSEGSYEYTRRLITKIDTLNKGLLDLAKSGAFSSKLIAISDFYNNTIKTVNYNLKDTWNKQTHISNIPLINNNSSFWNLIKSTIWSNILYASRHTFCCKEREGGQKNEINNLQKRISQLTQLLQLGIQFNTSGTTNTDEVSVGKIIYIGRPISNTLIDREQEDIFYSGKFLVTKIKHNIQLNSVPIPRYYCTINAYKDSIGEE